MDKVLNELIVVKGKVIEQERAYTATSGKELSYEAGAKMVKTHFDENPDDVIAHYMGKNQVEAILAQEGCVGLRMFPGINELGIKTMILVGVDKNGKNILGSRTGSKDIIMGGTRVCPPYCDGPVSDDTGW